MQKWANCQNVCPFLLFRAMYPKVFARLLLLSCGLVIIDLVSIPVVLAQLLSNHLTATFRACCCAAKDFYHYLMSTFLTQKPILLFRHKKPSFFQKFAHLLLFYFRKIWLQRSQIYRRILSSALKKRLINPHFGHSGLPITLLLSSFILHFLWYFFMKSELIFINTTTNQCKNYTVYLNFLRSLSTSSLFNP